MRNQQTVELRVIRRYIGIEGHRLAGERIRVPTWRARQLLEQGICRLANRAGPTEVKPIGPAELKEDEATEKKSSGAATGGRSTDSLFSSEPGPETAPSSSAADPASRKNKRTGPRKRKIGTADASA